MTVPGSPSKTTARVGLTKDAIVERALRLMDSKGASWLTMRRLAGDLGISAPTLYWHVRDRQALIDAAIDVALDGMADGPPPTGDWRADVAEFMTRMRRHLTTHPCVTELMRDRYPASAEAMTRRALDIFAGAGMSAADAAQAARLMIWRVLGFATVENSIRTGTAYHEPANAASTAYRVSSPMPSGDDVEVPEAKRLLATLDVDALFRYDVTLFVKGLAATRIA